MLKKITSGALAVLMLSSCMGGNVKAGPHLPAAHMHKLVDLVRNRDWCNYGKFNTGRLYVESYIAKCFLLPEKTRTKTLK